MKRALLIISILLTTSVAADVMRSVAPVGGGGGGTTLPVDDGTAVVKGSADPTKLLRFEADGFTTGTTRVVSVPNADFTMICPSCNNTYTTGTSIFSSSSAIALGTSGAVGGMIRTLTAQTPDSQGLITGTTSNAWLVIEEGDQAFDFAHAAATTPTIWIQSNNQVATEFTGYTWLGATPSRTTVTVDGATTFALASAYIVLACTGAETINTITGGKTGMILLLENTDTECTIADDENPTAADAIDLTGAANDVGAVAKVIALLYNGTHWLELYESDN